MGLVHPVVEDQAVLDDVETWMCDKVGAGERIEVGEENVDTNAFIGEVDFMVHEIDVFE